MSVQRHFHYLLLRNTHSILLFNWVDSACVYMRVYVCVCLCV